MKGRKHYVRIPTRAGSALVRLDAIVLVRDYDHEEAALHAARSAVCIGTSDDLTAVDSTLSAGEIMELLRRYAPIEEEWIYATTLDHEAKSVTIDYRPDRRGGVADRRR